MPESEQKSGLLRALGVLNLVAEQAPETIGVSAVSRELGLPKAVAQRILKEFTTAGYLAFDDASKKYRLGTASVALGLAALRSLDVPDIARPHLRRLVAQTGETATLSVLQGSTRIYVDQVLSPHEIRMSVMLGTSHALHAGSSSKAILANLPDREIDTYLAGHRLDALTGATITDVEELRADLEKIRSVGYAVSYGERQSGARSIASPIFRGAGEVVGSISLCGPQDRFNAEVIARHKALVVESARLVSAELGHRAPQDAP